MADVAGVVEGRERHAGDAGLERGVAAELDIVAVETERPEVGADDIGTGGVRHTAQQIALPQDLAGKLDEKIVAIRKPFAKASQLSKKLPPNPTSSRRPQPAKNSLPNLRTF